MTRFKNVGVGDTILVKDGGPGHEYVKRTVTRITPKYLVIHRVFLTGSGEIANEYDTLYSKETGLMRGYDPNVFWLSDAKPIIDLL